METSYLYRLDDVELAIKFTHFFETKNKTTMVNIQTQDARECFKKDIYRQMRSWSFRSAEKSQQAGQGPCSKPRTGPEAHRHRRKPHHGLHWALDKAP